MSASTPITFTATDVISAALSDINALAQGESPTAAESQEGFRRLNALISQLRLQEFSAPFIARQVFPISSQQNTYTIGPGGELNTDRPQTINGCGLLLTPTTGTFTITAASPTLRTFTVAGDQTGSFLSGSDFMVSGSTGNDGNYTIVTATFSVSTTVLVGEDVPSALSGGTITVLGDANGTTEIPVSMLTDNAYQALRIKGLQNTQWTQAYYNPTYSGGLGLLWLWPKPTTATNALVLYLDHYVSGFADLTTSYNFPPGYFDLFEYGLALRLLAPYGFSNSSTRGDLMQQFTAAATLVKRQNVPRNDMPTDTGSLGGPSGTYNILTDSTH